MAQRKVARSDPHFPLPLSHPDLKSLGISITPRKLTLRQGARHLGAFGVLMSFNGSPDPAMPKCHSLCFASIAVKMLSGRHLKFKCRRGTLKSGPWFTYSKHLNMHTGQCTQRNCQGQWVQSRRRGWELNFHERIWHCCAVARMLFVDLMFTNESCSKHPKKCCFAMVMWYIPKVGTNGDQGYVSLCRCTKRPLGREGAIFIPYCFCGDNLER